MRTMGRLYHPASFLPRHEVVPLLVKVTFWAKNMEQQKDREVSTGASFGILCRRIRTAAWIDTIQDDPF